MKKMRKRLVSWLLCAAMVLAQCPQIAFAEETQTGGCEHHKFHDEDCGYIEGTLEIPCTHDHTEECFRTVTQCVHVHDESCYGGDEDIPGEATPSDARERKAENCAHVCDADSGCVTEILDCSHEKGEHDEACGYVPAVEGAPCGYVCEICEIELATPPNAKPGVNGETLLITGWEWVDGEEIQYSEENGQWELALPGVSRENQADFDTVVSMLPEGIYAELEGADEPEEIGLSGWKCDDYQTDANEWWPVTGTYTFRGILPEGYGLAEDAKPLKVVVDLGGAKLLEGDTGDFVLTSKDGETLKPGEDYAFDADAGVLTIKTFKPLTISMAEGVTVQTSQRIVVNVSGGNANITLRDVKIDVPEESPSPFEIQNDTACQITLLGDNTLKAASPNAGLYVPENAKLIITEESTGRLDAESQGSGAAGIGGKNGDKAGKIIIEGGTIRAVGGAGGAGIGGGANSTFQEIKITGGNITAQGRGPINGGAGIGDGSNYTGSNGSGFITIAGGMIQAIGGKGAAGIGKGCGNNAKRPTFSTENGKAVIFASSIEVKNQEPEAWYGMIFDDNVGVVRGDIILNMYAEMPKDSTLFIGDGNSLTIENNVTFRNLGTITIETGGQLINRGAIENYGTISKNGGTLTNNGTIFRPSSSASVTFSKGGVTLAQNTATYGDTITITATVSGKENTRSALARSAEENTADFYLGDSKDGVKLNTGTVYVQNGTAELKIQLANNDKIRWGIGDNKNTITVDFGRSKESDSATEGLLGQTVIGQLIIEKAVPTITELPTVVLNPELTELTYGVTFGDIVLEGGSATGVNDSPVGGKFAWEAKDDDKPNAGTHSYGVKFTPGDDYNQYYNPVTENVSVEVEPASLEDDWVSMKDKVDYNGSDQKQKIRVYPNGSKFSVDEGNDYTVEYTRIGGPADDFTSVGKIQVTVKGINNYQGTVIKTYEIIQSKTEFANGIKTYLDGQPDESKGEFTYGDTILVEATLDLARPKPPWSARSLSFADPAPNEAALYVKIDEKYIQLTDAKPVTAGEKLEFTYDTTEKLLPIGEQQTLKVKYVGNENMTGAEKTTLVTLNPLLISATLEDAKKPYDGSTEFEQASLRLTDVFDGDDVTGTANGSVEDPNVGAGKAFTVSDVTLSGEDAGWYSLNVENVSGTVEITKAPGAAIADLVTGSYVLDGNTFTYTVNSIIGAEYSRDGSTWQDSNVFTGFTAEDSGMVFYARMKGDPTHEAGEPKNTGAVTFDRLTRTENPALHYTVSGATGNKKITIAPMDGCEYTFDGGSSWGRVNEKTFAADTIQTIGIRYEETGTHLASAGAMEEVSLINQEQAAPPAFTLVFTDNGDGTFTAVIPSVDGGEYSFDGQTWSGENTKKDCQPDTEYTGFVRYTAKDGYNASPAVSDTQMSPKVEVTDPEEPPVTPPEKPSEKPENSGSSEDDSSSSSSGIIYIDNKPLPSYVEQGTWTQMSGGGWSFRGGNGAICRNGWVAAYNPYADVSKGQSPYDWFYFDGTGRMVTGWLEDGGHKYYLNPVSDGTLGKMLTGWQKIDGRWYYFHEISDGTRGSMEKDIWIGGYYVDKDGIWKED